ncbi:BCC2 [Auxenochlorella protothecoides x Auxenochlorella symbiontica]
MAALAAPLTATFGASSSVRSCRPSGMAFRAPAMRAARPQGIRLHATRMAEISPPSSSGKGGAKPKSKKEEESDSESEDEFFDEDGEGLDPQQVESLLATLCEGTDLAHLELKLPGFQLRVRRSLSKAASPAAAAAAPVAAPAPVPAPAPAPATPPPVASADEADESRLAVVATKVGVFRRGRYVKGKRVGKGPLAAAGDSVKKGQVLAFVEQLGTHWPVEAPQSGELEGFLLEDGDPVEYNQTVLELTPFFGGHIIGDKKYR